MVETVEKFRDKSHIRPWEDQESQSYNINSAFKKDNQYNILYFLIVFYFNSDHKNSAYT